VARQWFADGEILAFLPLGGAQPPQGGHSVAMVWSVRQERVDALLQRPAAEFESQLDAASRGALGQLSLASERAAWPLQLARADRWCGPGWVLAGDAAHSVHPLAGQGLNLGLADAQALAGVLRERDYWRPVSDIKLLRRYERARKAQVQAMGAATDGLQQLFARNDATTGWLRNWGMKGFELAGPLKHWVARQAAGRL
jgi:2-polyprenyl-6-methoxyphenol hydroxylase-like FAD-dependent oxidoreductase